MRRINQILFILLFAVSGCNKDKTAPNTGTVTIDNELSGSGPYYAMGFSVKTGQKVSTLSSPLDVVTVFVDNDINMVVKKLFLSCENFENSFSIYGSYSDAGAAQSAFNNLKSFTDPSTWAATADSIVPNQVWLFRTSDLKYAKLRIISIFSEIRQGMPFPFAQCTFDWVYQPDGTKIFP